MPWNPVQNADSGTAKQDRYNLFQAMRKQVYLAYNRFVTAYPNRSQDASICDLFEYVGGANTYGVGDNSYDPPRIFPSGDIHFTDYANMLKGQAVGQTIAKLIIGNTTVQQSAQRQLLQPVRPYIEGNYFATSTATTGNKTIAALRGRVAVAAASTSVVITNKYVTPLSSITALLSTADATARITSAVPGNGSFTINYVAPTGQVNIDFSVVNP